MHEHYKLVQLHFYSQAKTMRLHIGRMLPPMREYFGIDAPSPAQLLEVYETARRSSLTLTGISDFDRSRREIQSVGCDLSFSLDHTHGVLKNYSGEVRANAKAVADAAIETGEIPFAVITPTTSTSDFAHAVEQFARRPNVSVKQVSTDTWPNKDAFWKMIFGPAIYGALGFFHFLNRIIRTMRDSHENFGPAVNELRACFIEPHPEDVAKVESALIKGEWSSQQPAMTPEAVESLKGTKEWRSAFGSYVRETIGNPGTAVVKMKAWLAKRRYDRDSTKGYCLCTQETVDACRNAERTVEYIEDRLSMSERYRAVAAPKRSKHQLPSYRSLRGTESLVESWHDAQQNLANTGSSIGLANCINHIGLADHNAKMRWRVLIESMLPEERGKIKYCFQRVNPHKDHCILALINDLARNCGVSEPVYQHVRRLPEDNGERFFSEYYFQQLERNQGLRENELTDRCQCRLCALNPTPLRHGQLDSHTISSSPGRGAITSSPGRGASDMANAGKVGIQVEASEARTRTSISTVAMRTTTTTTTTETADDSITTEVPAAQLACSVPFTTGTTTTGTGARSVLLQPPPTPMLLPWPWYTISCNANTMHHTPLTCLPFLSAVQFPGFPPISPNDPLPPVRRKPQVQDYCCETYKHHFSLNPARGGKPRHDQGCKTRMATAFKFIATMKKRNKKN